MSSNQVPSIGRVVHFVTNDGRHVPADICAVHEPFVNLYVKDDVPCIAGFERGVMFDASGQRPFTWHWPEYVPAKDEAKF